MIGCFKSLREAIRTGAAKFVESQSELMKASEKPSCTVRTQRSDQDSSRPLLARGRTAISRFYRASVPVGPPPPPSAPSTAPTAPPAPTRATVCGHTAPPGWPPGRPRGTTNGGDKQGGGKKSTGLTIKAQSGKSKRGPSWSPTPPGSPPLTRRPSKTAGTGRGAAAAAPRGCPERRHTRQSPT